MKAAISAKSRSRRDLMAPSLGGAKGYFLFETDSEEYEFHDFDPKHIQGEKQPQHAAQQLLDAGVEAVVVQELDDTAMKMLEDRGVDIHFSPAATVEEAAQSLKKGKLARWGDEGDPEFERG